MDRSTDARPRKAKVLRWKRPGLRAVVVMVVLVESDEHFDDPRPSSCSQAEQEFFPSVSQNACLDWG